MRPLGTGPAALILIGALSAPAMAGEAVSSSLSEYAVQGAGPFDAAAGERLWRRTFTPAGGAQPRSCTTCHGTDLRTTGRHVRTGKIIDPMAPSVDPRRLSKRTTIEKWLLRNCKWTLGRECSPQEKGDILSFLSRQ